MGIGSTHKLPKKIRQIPESNRPQNEDLAPVQPVQKVRKVKPKLPADPVKLKKFIVPKKVEVEQPPINP